MSELVLLVLLGIYFFIAGVTCDKIYAAINNNKGKKFNPFGVAGLSFATGAIWPVFLFAISLNTVIELLDADW